MEEDAMKDLRTFLFIMAILIIAWFFTGGHLRQSSKTGWFLNKNGSPVKNISSGKNKTASSSSSSSLSNKTSTSSEKLISEKPDFVVLKTSGAKETSPSEEYLEIKADKKNKSPMRITGWKLEGKGGLDVAIGKGASFIHTESSVQPQEDIYLKPGEKAVIATGLSPIGTSFKINKCVGYFNQFHEFYPNLNAECPALREEDLPKNIDSDDKCFNYIKTIPACKTMISIPYKNSSLSSSCQDFVIRNANYKSCVEKHKDDLDFYSPEWRVYLGRNEELWKKSRETINLYDEKNNLIDSASY